VAASSGGVTVRVEPTRAAPTACVVVGIPFTANHWVLHALKAGTPAALHDVELFDQTLVAYVAYEAVLEKLAGSTVEAIKNKVVSADCGAQGGEFLISVTCAPTLAAARKCVGIVLQNLRWGALYQRYANWCKAFEVRADKAAFSHAAAVANAATQRGVVAVFTGKVEADHAGAARTADLLSRKAKDSGPKEAGRPREVALADIGLEGGAVAKEFKAHAAPGLSGVVVLGFVVTNGRGEPPHLASGILYVPVRTDALVRRLAAASGAASKPAKYASSLLRLGEDTRGALVYTAAKGCFVGTASLTVGGGASEAGASGAIRAALGGGAEEKSEKNK
jgi:hypothetical protein